MGKELLYDVEFSPGGKTYSFLSETDSYEVGDLVIVQAGRNNNEVMVRIVAKRPCDGEKASLPAMQMKRILRHANEAECANCTKQKTIQKRPRIRASQNNAKENEPYVAEGLQPDGSLIICYEDYGVGTFGGMDYEVTYELNPENTKKLQSFLSARYVGSIESMLIQECGKGYRKKALIELFEEAGVEYKHFSWIS